MENKTHYRKVFKSDHLGVADLEEFMEEGRELIFTIDKVTQHKMEHGDKNSGIVVAGRRVSANIAHFKENIKPLVLNSTNSKMVKYFNNESPFVEDWSNTKIELYIDNSVKMKGEVVGGVRIKSSQPKEKTSPLYEEFKKLYQEKADKIPTKNFDRVERYFNKKIESKYQDTINYLKTL